MWRKIVSSKAFKWTVTILAFLGFVALVVGSIVTKNKKLAKLAADLLEKSHKNRIESLQAEVSVMETDLSSNGAAIKKKKEKIRALKSDMVNAHLDAGLSAEEIASRFKKAGI